MREKPGDGQDGRVVEIHSGCVKRISSVKINDKERRCTQTGSSNWSGSQLYTIQHRNVSCDAPREFLHNPVNNVTITLDEIVKSRSGFDSWAPRAMLSLR